ncbi:hypothetical protein FRC04_001451 [Tulasnella sp. 424]|nr:hypothetical protein FRC04_001451 [Tulasnella sp. 424]
MPEPASSRHTEQEVDASPSRNLSTLPFSQEPGQVHLRQIHGHSVNSLTDAYLLTGDAKEHARLDAQHAAITLLHGGFVPRGSNEAVNAAIKNPYQDQRPRILDLGTGSGAWAIAMARQFTEADVLGLDLVPVNPGSEPPSNCRFEVCDANKDLDRYPALSFNVVHVRTVLQGIKDYQALFYQAARMLRPGGVFLIVDGTWAAFDVNKNRIQAENTEKPGFTWLHKFMTVLRTATTARNPSFASLERVDEIVKGMGNQTWESVSSAPAFMPVGDWPADTTERQAGEFTRQSLLQALTSTRPLLLTHGLSADEVDQLSEELRSELNENKCPHANLTSPSPTVKSTPLRQMHGQAVNSLTDAYLFAGDAAEHARLDAQHGAITLTLGGLFPSAARDVFQEALASQDGQPKPAILDIGTGSGAWAIDMAKQLPEADVLGIDLVPVNPGSEPPLNCRFEVCDANVGLDRYPSNSFNVVHVQYVLQGVEDYPSFFRQVARLLRPGGICISIEPAPAAFDAEKNRINATKPSDLVRNPSIASVERVDEILRELGDGVWSSVSTTLAFIPVGAWSTNAIEQRAGGLMRQSMLHAISSTRPLFLSRGFSVEDVERLAEGLRAELEESRIQQYMRD